MKINNKNSFKKGGSKYKQNKVEDIKGLIFEDTPTEQQTLKDLKILI